MLSISHYGRPYVDDARDRIDAQVAAWRELADAGARFRGSGAAKVEYEQAAAAFEVTYFTNLVHVLDNYFARRDRALEGEDGNALNEVRVLCASLMNNGGKLAADQRIGLAPERSVLGYTAGDPIRLGEEDFVRLAEAFFAEIEAKFV
ncbi:MULTISPECIES: hypothetical protein [unclassified Streptomyces]|uniref:hypothetical protein n=1 Tax=unclassified Streptomyces TaxID=2593676 RepID=UPI002E297EBA|nr:hypothetical protein [Streptomyces sp. NBC_00223]